jgi:AraC-like DNA-binding protein
MMVSRLGYVFSCLIAASTALMAMGDFISRELVHWSVIMANATLCSVFVATQRHPDFNRLLKIETKRAQYEQSKIGGLDVAKIMDRINEIMEEEKAFADEELTLKNLASELDITAHQLSEILNEKLKKNFNSFVNEYRIREAKIMLIDEPERSVLSIGIAVGFNSHTTFCTAFSRLAGCSPAQYRKTIAGR